MTNEKAKFVMNEKIYREILSIANSIEDVEFVSKELNSKIEELIGTKSDIETITWDSNNETQDLSNLYSSVLRFLNTLGEQKESVKESYDKLLMIETLKIKNS